MMSSNYKNYNKKISNENISELSNLDLKQPNIKILELGCGDASLWNKNFNYIPSNWEITLTDFSDGMLKDAKKKFRRKKEVDLILKL